MYIHMYTTEHFWQCLHTYVHKMPLIDHTFPAICQALLILCTMLYDFTTTYVE